MHHRWRAKEPFLASIGFLGNGCVEADDSGHRYDSAPILTNLFADNASDFCVVILSVRCRI